MKSFEWFEWTGMYSLISIDQDLFPNVIIQTRLGAHLIQTVRQSTTNTSTTQATQWILNRVRTSTSLKRLLQQCLTLTGNDQELNALCLSLMD
jgi:hypothetical protein